MTSKRIPEDVPRLWARMLQNSVGVTNSVTAVEIEFKLDTSGLQKPLESTLNSMVRHELAEQQIEVVPKMNTSGERPRLIRTYQVSVDSLERLL